MVGFIAILLLSLSWHEAAHAWVADRLGDPTARLLGRVTLNPIKHLDPFMSVLLPSMLIFMGSPFIFGGGKPVPINVFNFRHRARDFMLVALAGPGSNLLLAVGFAAGFIGCAWGGVFPTDVVANPYGPDNVFAPKLLSKPETLLQFILQMGVVLNAILAVFNMIPVPPLDGSRVIGWLLPRPIRPHWYRLDRVGFVVLIAGLFFLDGLRYLRVVLFTTLDVVGNFVDQITLVNPLG